MRRIARLPRQILAVSAATFIGALGAVALTAAPASAHVSSIESKTECVEGKPNTAKVTWTITNKYDNEASLSAVQINGAGAKVGDIRDGNKLTKAGDKLKGSQEFSTKEAAPTLSAKIDWADKNPSQAVSDTAVFPRGGCAPTEVKKPTYAGVSNCDGTMTVTIKNTTDATRTFAVNGSGEFVKREDVKAGDSWVVEVPKDNSAKVAVKYKLVGANKWENDDDKRIDYVKPDVCFTATPTSTCEGLSIKVVNTGPKAITATVTIGGVAKETAIEPGKDNTFVADGVDGLVATLTVKGSNDGKEFKWAKPADCAGGGLPVTGVNAGLLAGAALVLVSGGGGLFFMARRRRVRFAA